MYDWLEAYLCIAMITWIMLYVIGAEKWVRPKTWYAYILVAIFWPIFLIVWLFYAGSPEEWD